MAREVAFFSKLKLNWEKFFRTLAPGALPLIIYLATRAPTITWRNHGADSGDLVTAAFTLGIPHPPGYPLYTLLAALFSHLPFGEPAQNVAAFSSLAASAAIIFLALAGFALLSRAPLLLGAGVGEGVAPLARWIVPSIALTFAFAPAFWSQATIAEVNALAAFFAAALLAVSLSDSPHRLYYTAAILGLGLTHHLTILLLLPSTIILLAPARCTRMQYLRALFLVLCPLALYLYLPIRAAAHPPVNWGDPQTWERFLWVISGTPYRQYLFAVPGSEIFTRVGLSARLIFEQFTVVGVAVGVWGAVRMAADARARRVFIALLLAFSFVLAYAVTYNSRDSFVYLTPAYLVFALWMMWGINDVALRWKQPRPDSPLTPLQRGVGRIQTALLVALVLLPLYNLVANYTTMNVSNDFTARDYARAFFNNLPDRAIVIADGDEHFFALEYYRHVSVREKNQIVVSVELLQYDWYFANIRREMPDLSAAPTNPFDRLIEIVDAGLTRGVYTTTRFDALASYALERRADATFRVLGRLY